MSPARRIVLLVVAALVFVGGIVFAASSGDEAGGGGGGPSAATEPGAREGAQTDAGAGGDPDGGGRTTTPGGDAPPRVETIRMRGRAPVGEPQTIEYAKGDTVRLRFVSDVAEEVHIHGYDEYVDVPADGSGWASFEADLEGIFEVESHGSGELLARLEVRP